MAKKKKHGEEEAGEAWLLPYSDLMTLLLAVFIVLFAVSKVDQKKAVAMAEAFSEKMMSDSVGGGAQGVPKNTPIIEDSPAPTIANAQSDTPTETSITEKYLGQLEYNNLEKVKQQLDEIFKKDNMSSTVSTSIDMRGLVITLNNAILFDSGKADIKGDHQDALTKIAAAITTLDKYIRIEGHTDNVPISGTQYPSNWELSTARASSVARLFIGSCGIQPDRIVAVGYGEYRPVGDNNTAEGRASNRRIDIIVLSEKYNNLESQILADPAGTATAPAEQAPAATTTTTTTTTTASAPASQAKH